ncbi:MAG: hypothetical protein GXP29_05735 [Planctomycetes bacterium]|nr:hypothetical protein [Planctomycetota bacterium]
MAESSEFERMPTSAIRALVDAGETDVEVFLPGGDGKGPVLYSGKRGRCP